MNPIYVGLGVAILGLVVAIAWALSTRRVIVSSKPQETASPLLAPNHDQRVRDLIAPVFKDMIDKEHAAKVKEAMYQAYKGVKLDAS